MDLKGAKIVQEGESLFFEQAGLRIPADKNSLLNTLARLDDLPPQGWKTLAEVHGLPVEPFEKRLLKPVLLGVVQATWYQDVKGEIPETCELNHQKRVEKYLKEHAELKDAPPTKKRTGGDKPVGGRPANKASTYAFTEAGLEAAPSFKGQQRLIADVLLHGPATTAQIAEQVKSQLETKQPAERVVGFYLNAWKNKALIYVVGEQANLPAETTPAEMASSGDPEATAQVEALGKEVNPEIERTKKQAEASRNKKKKK